MKARAYEMNVRAEAVAATGSRVLAAARERFAARPYDEVKLDDIASDAGVTVQTVLRRFGSKEGVVRAISEQAQVAIVAGRDQAPVGDVSGAVSNLVGHYEQVGAEVLHLLRQELRVPVFAEITANGRTYHHQWVNRVFAPWLDQRSGTNRQRLQGQLIAVCDVYTWHLLRQQCELSPRSTEQSICELIEGVLS